LDAVRERFHEAQCELAKKAERNRELQRQLQSLQEKRKHPDEIASQKMRQEIAALRKNNGELAKKLAAAKRELAAQGTKSEGVDRPKKAKKDTPKRPGSITVRY